MFDCFAAGENATPEQIAEVRRAYGFDQPLWKQFVIYVGQVGTGNLGNSIISNRPVLRDLSFTAHPGQTTAIIGSTGAGKTTMVNLVPRLFDVTAGAVYVDGVDVRQLQPDLLELPSHPSWSFPPRPWTSHVRWIAPSPHDADLVLVGIELGGLMRSTDAGESWEYHRPGAQRDVHSLAWHPTAAGRAYEAAGGWTAWSEDADLCIQLTVQCTAGTRTLLHSADGDLLLDDLELVIGRTSATADGEEEVNVS